MCTASGRRVVRRAAASLRAARRQVLVTNMVHMSRTADTRRRLLQAALELASTRGFEQTTVAEIAERASVSEMTFFRHFPTKASVLVDDPYDPLIAEAIRRRPGGESSWTATVGGIGDAWTSVTPPEEEAVRERMAIVAATPSLRSALAEGSAATARAIAEALLARGTPPDEAGVVAASVVAGLNEALLRWAPGDGPLDAAIRGALDTLARR